MSKRSRGRKRRSAGVGRRADREAPPDGNPLGVYGSDWTEQFAFIAGHTPNGEPFGVAWEEAAYLQDDPEIVAWLGEAECQRLWGGDAEGERTRDRPQDPDDPHRQMPY